MKKYEINKRAKREQQKKMFGEIKEPDVVWKKPEEQNYPPKSKRKYQKNKKWYSVTGLVSKMFPFNQKEIAEKLSKKYKKGKKEKHKIYTGLKPYEIVWLWFEKSTVGTILHNASEKYSRFGTNFKYTSDTFRVYRTGSFIEDAKIRRYYLKTLKKLGKKVRGMMWTDEKGKLLEKEFDFFIKYDKMMKQKGFSVFQFDTVDCFGFNTKSLAVEVRIKCDSLKVCGTFDCLYYNEETGEFITVDLKRSKDPIRILNIKKRNEMEFLNGTKRIEDVFSDYREILTKKQFWKYKDFVKYSLQLAIYTFALRKDYGMKNFKEMHIVRLNAENSECPEVTRINPNIFDKRLERIGQIKCNLSV